jgi:hypothetical protein
MIYRHLANGMRNPKAADVRNWLEQYGDPVALGLRVIPMLSGGTNWFNRISTETGEVLDPDAYPNRKFDLNSPWQGHAVAVMGFVEDPTARGGGWFVIRNSNGSHWGRNAAVPLPIPMPLPPGFGCVTAGYVDRFASELLWLEPQFSLDGSGDDP